MFDIETSALEAVGAGWLLCCVVKPLDGKPIVFRYDEFHCKQAKETDLVRAVINELCSYDLLIGHNIEKFDWPYVKSRASILGLDQPHTRPLYYDTKKAFRGIGFRTVDNGYGFPSCSLDMVVDFFKLSQLKTKIYPNNHWKAIWEEGGHRTEAMDDLVDHCVRDVKMNEAIFPLILKADTNATFRRLK